jgi:hypothetical protein
MAGVSVRRESCKIEDCWVQSIEPVSQEGNLEVDSH